MGHRGKGRRLIGAGASVLLVAALMAFHVVARAGADEPRCRSHGADSRERAAMVGGAGLRTVVIGDSWSVGLGLEDLGASWPSRLSGRTRVAGFSGSGLSAGASPCPGASFAERADAALRSPADLVVVQGGLNDFDQPDVAVERGFRRLMRRLAGTPVVVVGPASAPARAEAVPRIDRLLAELSAAYGVRYVATSDLELSYLGDGLHLTAEGHRTFGDAIDARVRGVTPAPPRRP